MIELKNIVKTFTGKNTEIHAVRGVTLNIEDGDIFGFIGHNGAGKTTTIKAVVGILDIKQGDVLINGKSMKTNPLECKQELAYVPDNPEVYDYMKGIEYLNFIADVYGTSDRAEEYTL